MKKADVIIVGSGVSALQLARHISRDLHVIILTKSTITTSNSSLAQGGVSAALSQRDQPRKHYMDTVEAGCYINHPQRTKDLTEEAIPVIETLIEEGLPFDRWNDGTLQFGREGGHSEERILHCGGDQTGRYLLDHLIHSLSDHIEIMEHEFVYDLIMNQGACVGVKSKGRGGVQEFRSPHIILATGGCGQLYSCTSNSHVATGDGLALAYLAGAELMDMEFLQFHPTLLYKHGSGVGLVTEALRGAGATLVNQDGAQIMQTIHSLGNLAPRHIVAETIFQLRQKGEEVFLDLTNVQEPETRFPTVAALCQTHSIDLNLIPVAPGAHFLMGGIVTDSLGRTTVKGLYAVGEAACTGVHGANRLASNSLLEGLVFGKRLADWINRQPRQSPSERSLQKRVLAPTPLPTITDIQESMMERVGIVRNEQGLLEQMRWLESYQIEEWAQYDWRQCSEQDITTMFMLQTSLLITKAALERKESRGGHIRSDCPEQMPEWQNKTIIHQRTEMRKTHEPIHH